MTRSFMLIGIGSLVTLSPFSGLPMSILTWILPVLGILAIAIGISYRQERARSSSREVPHNETSFGASA